MATDVDAAKAISLVDNTTPTQPLEHELTRSETSSARFHLTKHLTKGSVKKERQRRKYNKWQPDRLGISDTESASENISRSTTKDAPNHDTAGKPDGVDLLNIAPAQSQATEAVKGEENPASSSELEVLYENQRGWFLFGVPSYSHRSLLQFDPPAWVNKDYHESPVDITNAQVPDPSWQWAWQSWYVDMSGDVDEEGWQYSFSFVPKCGWHGTHPWFHSYVRRRRWVRLRVKKSHAARKHNGAEQTDFHRAHLLNEDYFTIHSQNLKSEAPSIAPPSSAPPGAGPSTAYPRRDVDVDVSPERPVDENIENIPTLLRVLKDAIVDREKIEALKKFLAEGGDELYYLPDKIPEVLSLFVFQTSRWQFLKILQDEMANSDPNADHDDASFSDTDKKEADARTRRRNNISRAIDAVNREVSGYDVFDPSKDAGDGLKDSPLHHRAATVGLFSPGKGKERSFNEIRGIPQGAGIGKEGHIY